MTDLNQNLIGWSDRREKARSKQADRNTGDRAAIRAERERLYQAQAESGRKASESEQARNEVETCSCTACGGTGRLTLPKAMAVVEAMHNYGFADRTPSKASVASLAALVRGDDIPPGHPHITFTYGSVSPASPSQAVETVEPQKPSKGKVKAVETTSDGFLIDSE